MRKWIAALLVSAGLTLSPFNVKADATEMMGWYHTWQGEWVLVDPLFYYAALKVVPQESGWQAGVVSAGYDSNYQVYYHHCGWFQIEMHTHQSRFYRRGWSWEDCKDPGKNSAIAYEIWSEQYEKDNWGWGPWPWFKG